jgi:hypothetical protein
MLAEEARFLKGVDEIADVTIACYFKRGGHALATKQRSDFRPLVNCGGRPSASKPEHVVACTSLNRTCTAGFEEIASR